MSPSASVPIAPALRTSAPSLASVTRRAPGRARGGDADLLDELRRPGPPGSPRRAGRRTSSDVHAQCAMARSSRPPAGSSRSRARDGRRHDVGARLLVEHARRADGGGAPVERAAPTRAAALLARAASRSWPCGDRAVVGHQRGGAALERVERDRGQLGRAEGARTARRAPGRPAAAAGSGRTAARRARTTARSPSARGCARRRRRRSARRRRGAGRARTSAASSPSTRRAVEVDHASPRRRSASASTAPVGVIATSSPTRALTLPGGPDHQARRRRGGGRRARPAGGPRRGRRGWVVVDITPRR